MYAGTNPDFDAFSISYDDWPTKDIWAGAVSVASAPGSEDYINADDVISPHEKTGTITGNYSVVPIPTSLWLFGSGLLVLVGMIRS